MRFKKTKEKYTHKPYWVASVINRGQMMRDIFYIIYPCGAGFNLFIKAGFTSPSKKICHVRKFNSAKTIANLMEKG